MTTIGTVDTAGIEDLLRQIPGKVQTDKVVDKALRAGAEVVRAQASANLKAHGSVDTGLLADSLRISRKSDDVPGLVEMVLKASSKLSMVVRKSRWSKTPIRARPSAYAHFVEFGTEHSPAAPFMRPALEAKRDEAERTIAAQVEAGVAKVAQQLGLTVK